MLQQSQWVCRHITEAQFADPANPSLAEFRDIVSLATSELCTDGFGNDEAGCEATLTETDIGHLSSQPDFEELIADLAAAHEEERTEDAARRAESLACATSRKNRSPSKKDKKKKRTKAKDFKKAGRDNLAVRIVTSPRRATEQRQQEEGVLWRQGLMKKSSEALLERSNMLASSTKPRRPRAQTMSQPRSPKRPESSTARPTQCRRCARLRVNHKL